MLPISQTSYEDALQAIARYQKIVDQPSKSIMTAYDEKYVSNFFKKYMADQWQVAQEKLSSGYLLAKDVKCIEGNLKELLLIKELQDKYGEDPINLLQQVYSSEFQSRLHASLKHDLPLTLPEMPEHILSGGNPTINNKTEKANIERSREKCLLACFNILNKTVEERMHCGTTLLSNLHVVPHLPSMPKEITSKIQENLLKALAANPNLEEAVKTLMAAYSSSVS